MPPTPAIFVHAWWRSASTWLWLKLREQPALRCYYEPLNERIATLRGTPGSAVPPGLPAMLRHGHSEQGYFAEFAPLLESGTLAYVPRLAYARYLLTPRESDPQLEAYLGRLIAHSLESGLRPVLCFCRSQMRSEWMRGKFGGLHVAQVRCPATQFRSFAVAPYFTQRMMTIAARLCAQLPAAFEHIPSFHRQVAAGTAPGERIRLPQKEIAAVFALLWTASTLQAAGAADLVVDVDRLSLEPSRRAAVRAWFSQHAGEIDLEDCRVPGAAESGTLEEPMRGWIEAAADALRGPAAALAVFDRDRAASHLDELSAASRFGLERFLR